MNMLENKKIVFIGSGAMGEAMIRGLLSHDLVTPEQIVACDPVAARRQQMQEAYSVHVSEDNAAAVKDADVVVLSIKPQVAAKVFAGLKGHIPPSALVLSIIAGLPIRVMQEGLGHGAIVRCMPNTPAQVGMGMSVWTATEAVTQAQRAQAEAILGALGEQIAVEDEGYLDMATGLSGSGPGYVFLLIEALIDAGVHIGFSRGDAQKMVLQTIAGSVELMRTTGLHPADLRNRVTSPGGTTAAGLLELENSGVRAALVRAVVAAYRRSQELGAVYDE
ncbi:MAG: pyrroline-5-carboxylate reductase [Litorilinea sp.]|nr:MAG: pyrroline-5-carboxylate reductase [Litorilinea sp.]